ncbi:hypothetical protein BpHYR1_029021 [Brachionus plicatilis]|uniref:Uncharacterized protein n=1 Tax=Brachionus plicatilis TaxID=10195 RepID=A0A3M7SWU3_BRAPC|nr:hypothetical protein BpHYR1_029021 [Brachionus plicatilis]
MILKGLYFFIPTFILSNFGLGLKLEKLKQRVFDVHLNLNAKLQQHLKISNTLLLSIFLYASKSL